MTDFRFSVTLGIRMMILGFSCHWSACLDDSRVPMMCIQNESMMR